MGFQELLVSPGNRLALVRYWLFIPDPGSADEDMQIYDLASGSPGTFFNQLTVAGSIHRSTCGGSAPQFKAFLADLSSAGATPAQLQAADYLVPDVMPSDPTSVTWINDGVLQLVWTFRIVAVDPAFQGAAKGPYSQTFTMRFQMLPGPQPALIACNTGLLKANPPIAHHFLRPAPGDKDRRLRLDGQLISFPQLKGSATRTADMVAGYIPK
jgi:hypothetical protein